MDNLEHTFEYKLQEDTLIIENININPDLGISIVIPFGENLKDFIMEQKPEKIIFMKYTKFTRRSNLRNTCTRYASEQKCEIYRRNDLGI